MMILDDSLVELKSLRAQLEIQILGLRRRANDLERDMARLEQARRRGDVPSGALADARDRLQEVCAEIERTEDAIADLDVRILVTERSGTRGGVHYVEAASQRTSDEIDATRAEVLETIRALAAPIRRYQELAERHGRLSERIRAVTGKDNRYASYIGAALLRSCDQDEEIAFVLDFLKRMRVVA